MSRFYISQVIASGDKVVESTIEFGKGMNLIIGPSNTGKSHVMRLIDCVFGGKNIPFNKSETGYDTMTVCLKNDEDESVRLTRKIVLNKDETDEVPDSDVIIESTAANIESGTYSAAGKSQEYGTLLLRLLGINKPCQVIGSQDFKPQRLTFRSIWHFFFLEEENIFRSETVLDDPAYGRINFSLAALLFLLTGDDLHYMIPKMSKEEIEARQIHRAGVIFYLTDKLTELKKRREELQKAHGEAENVDLDGTIDSIFTELDSIESEIQERSDLRKDLMAKIYSLSSRLEEARFLQERYAALQSQYQSDIRRLEFIVDGKKHGHGDHYLATCPFCNHEIDDKSENSQAILAASAAEASRLRIQITDLDEVKVSTDADVRNMEEEMRQLNGKHAAVTKHIEQVLRPRADKLKKNFEKYKQAQDLQTQLHALDWMAQQLDTDIQGKQQEKDPTIERFSARDAFDKSVWQGYSDAFADMFSRCGYPNNPPVHLDLNISTDALIAGKKKKGLGKGYRAFVNTIVLFSLMKYMERINRYAPHLLILDSPILSLKEKKHQISEKDRATSGMRESLFRYMVENCGDNQVIIAENEIPENVDYSTVNIIEFTQDETVGRYGFLMSERN